MLLEYVGGKVDNKTHRRGEENSEKNNVILPSNELSLRYVVDTYNKAQTPRSDIGFGKNKHWQFTKR